MARPGYLNTTQEATYERSTYVTLWVKTGETRSLMDTAPGKKSGQVRWMSTTNLKQYKIKGRTWVWAWNLPFCNMFSTILITTKQSLSRGKGWHWPQSRSVNPCRWGSTARHCESQKLPFDLVRLCRISTCLKKVSAHKALIGFSGVKSVHISTKRRWWNVWNHSHLFQNVWLLQIGRAHVWTPVTNIDLVCRLLL